MRELTVRNPRGYVSELVSIPGPGQLRILWFDPATSTLAPSTPASVGVAGSARAGRAPLGSLGLNAASGP